MEHKKEQLDQFRNRAMDFIYGLDSYFDAQDDYRELEMVYDMEQDCYPGQMPVEELWEILRTFLADQYTESVTKWIMLAAESYNHIKNTILDGIEKEIEFFLNECDFANRQELIACYNSLPVLDQFDQLMLEHISLPDAASFDTDKYLSLCKIEAVNNQYLLYVDDALDEIVDELIHYLTDIEIELDNSFAELGIEIIEQYYAQVLQLMK